MTPLKTSSKRAQPAHRLPSTLKKFGLQELIQNNPLGLSSAQNSPWTLRDVWTLLWMAALLQRSVPAGVAWRQLGGISSPTARTVWTHIPALSMEAAAGQLSYFLTALPRRAPRRARRRLRRMGLLALDWHNQPFYGDPATPGTIGGKRKASTKRFFRYQTAEFVAGSFRYTVAVELVQKGNDRAVHAIKLIETAAQCHRIHTVVADGAYFSAALLAWLTAQARDFCIRAPLNERLLWELETVLDQLPQPGEVAYVRTAVGFPGDPDYTEFMAAFVIEKGEYRCYALPVQPHRSYAALLKGYKRRFGIETGYRVKKRTLIRTCTTNPVTRLLLFFLAVYVTIL